MQPRMLAGLLSFGVLASAVLFHAPLLRALAPASMCPAEKPTLETMESARPPAMAHLRGSVPAPSRTALGFELGKTTVVLAERPGCTWEVPAALLRCDEASGSLVARFDRRGLLVGLDRQLLASSPDVAVRAFDERAHNYEDTYGPAHARAGQATLAFLSAPLAQASMRYRFDDLAIDVTVTHVGGGVVLREQVRDIPTGQTGG